MRSTFLALVALLVHFSAAQETQTTSSSSSPLTKSQRWGYGFGASLIISMLGFIMSGLMIIILKSKKISASTLRYIILFLVAFAVGALLGDAVVHIIPDVFGEELGEQAKSAISSLMILVGFCTFVFIEKLFEWSGVAHSHGPDMCEGHDDHHEHAEKEPVKSKKDSKDLEDLEIAVVSEIKLEEGDKNLKEIETDKVDSLKEENIKDKVTISKQSTLAEVPSEEKINLDENKESSCWRTLFSLKNRGTTGIMILMADLLHNTMDGLAIGVAFASGDKHLALSTFIAVLAHEIPKEISGMGVLVHSKFPLIQALCCNGCFQFTALIGCLIGLAIGDINEAANAYILAFVAGNFFYISLVSMLPIVMKEKRKKHSFGLLIAFILGSGVMFALLEAEN